MIDVPPEAARLRPEQFDHYMRCRSKGQSHSIALILASCRAPSMDRTDERWRLSRDKHRVVGKHGKVPNAQGKYQAGLADYPGDPSAFVCSRGEARRVAASKGLTICDAPANAGSSVQKRNEAEGWA